MTLQRDIRAFFGNYSNACRLADDLLFRAGSAEAVDEACRRSAVGKLLPTALYVHRTALEALDPLLRVYEGCARAYLGTLDGANLIKLHRQSGKVSYLVYPDFETDPHPTLLRSVKLCLRTREIECFDYTASNNPPILHRKETLLTADHHRSPRDSRIRSTARFLSPQSCRICSRAWSISSHALFAAFGSLIPFTARSMASCKESISSCEMAAGVSAVAIIQSSPGILSRTS
jgi:DNA phosphorothioation-associated putative methyltransferase